MIPGPLDALEAKLRMVAIRFSLVVRGSAENPLSVGELAAELAHLADEARALARADGNLYDPLAVEVGVELARRFFANRGRKGEGRVEIHVDEASLAAMLALAFERGMLTRPPR